MTSVIFPLVWTGGLYAGAASGIFVSDWAPTVLWHLACAPLQQQTHPAAPGLDQLNGTGMAHVSGAFAIDLNDLVSNLHMEQNQRRERVIYEHKLAFSETYQKVFKIIKQ